MALSEEDRRSAFLRILALAGEQCVEIAPPFITSQQSNGTSSVVAAPHTCSTWSPQRFVKAIKIYQACALVRAARPAAAGLFLVQPPPASRIIEKLSIRI
jgi:hypothetical protein